GPVHTRMMAFVLFTPPWRLFLQLRRFQGQLPWLLGWVFARARSSSVKLETVVPRGAVGETPNIAARLQTLGAPNTELISESTKRGVLAALDFEDLGPQELKGVTEPLHVYCVLAAKYSTSRFEAAHAGPLTPLVGRSTELSLLLDRWQKVKEADGQV